MSGISLHVHIDICVKFGSDTSRISRWMKLKLSKRQHPENVITPLDIVYWWSELFSWLSGKGL